MLQVYRIANPLYIHDKSGEGARLKGGRWNNTGTPVLYAASSIVLAAWEVRVHLPNNIIPKDDAFSLAFFSLPEFSIFEATSLQSDWHNNEQYTKYLGEAWVAEGKFLCLKVPSSIIANEFNYLINPAHELASLIMIDQVLPFVFDTRTFSL
jgi:RES domain-containing protein